MVGTVVVAGQRFRARLGCHRADGRAAQCEVGIAADLARAAGAAERGVIEPDHGAALALFAFRQAAKALGADAQQHVARAVPRSNFAEAEPESVGGPDVVVEGESEAGAPPPSLPPPPPQACSRESESKDRRRCSLYMALSC